LFIWLTQFEEPGNIFKVRYKFVDEPDWGPDSKLKLYFSKITTIQPEDFSWGFKGADDGGLVEYRRYRSKTCPYCQKEGPIEDEDAEDRRRAFRSFYKLIASLRRLVRHERTNIPPRGVAFLRVDMQQERQFYSHATNSEESWNRVRQWLKICTDTHTKCPSTLNEDRLYPARLLDVGSSSDDGGRLRLVLTEEEEVEGHYMTLSHCWGKDQFITLKMTNIEKLRKGIDLLSLPQTFRDAMAITRKIGIRYLWIDSLCIIQDSEEDWLVESACMDTFYMNSFLNIGATGAHDGREGLFRERDPDEVYRPIIYKPDCKKHQNIYQQPYRLIEPSFMERNFLNEPLLQRAWVFQERFLSPRMLHFGSKQLFWECNEMNVCETFPLYQVHETPGASLYRLKSEIQSESDPESFSAKWYGCRLWYQIVKEYTSKDLTRGSDKLIALSGVARQFANHSLKLDVNDPKYYAGVWGSDFPRGLLWRTEDRSARRATKYRAPSWSWASLDGIIEPPFTGKITGKWLCKLFLAEIFYCQSENVFGPVTGGFLPVRGRLIEVEVIEENDKYHFECEGRKIKNSEWHPDVWTEVPQRVSCLCFFTGPNGLYGITVAHESDKFVRTGVFNIAPDDDRNAPADWTYPEPPFKELADVDIEEEELFAIH
jgi:hypothetical protein